MKKLIAKLRKCILSVQNLLGAGTVVVAILGTQNIRHLNRSVRYQSGDLWSTVICQDVTFSLPVANDLKLR